jgi:hypothetical protein
MRKLILGFVLLVIEWRSMGFYFVSDITEGSARVSMVPGSSLEPKEETIFEGILARLRAAEYAQWMNKRSDDGGSFDREPVAPNPQTPGAHTFRMQLQRMQERGCVLSSETITGRVEERDVLRETREEIWGSEPEKEELE